MTDVEDQANPLWEVAPLGRRPWAVFEDKASKLGNVVSHANIIPPWLVLVPALASPNELCPGICKPTNPSLTELLSILVFTTTIDSKLRWIQLVIFNADSVLSFNSKSVLEGSVMLLDLSCVYYAVVSS